MAEQLRELVIRNRELERVAADRLNTLQGRNMEIGRLYRVYDRLTAERDWWMVRALSPDVSRVGVGNGRLLDGDAT
jgi:hypothetical protein